MKEGEQRGKRKLRKEDESQTQHGSDQGVGLSSRQFVVLPYMKGVTEHLQRVFKKHDIKLNAKAGYTVRNTVVSPKDSLDMCKWCGVVYACDCEVCSKLYVGEMGRSVGERVEEHTKFLAKGDKKSALSEHQVKRVDTG